MKSSYIIVLLILVTSLNVFSQKEKAKAVYAYTYSIPEWYIPKEYLNYYAKINLPKDNVKVFVDGVYSSDLPDKISFNTFFDEKLYTNTFSGIKGFTRFYDQADFSDLTIQVVANIMHPKINIKTKGQRSYSKASKVEKPFSYELYFSYEIEFLIISEKDKKVLYKHIAKNSGRYYFPQSIKREVRFKDKKETVKYAKKMISKTDIVSVMLKSIMTALGGKSEIRKKIQFLKNKNSFFYFYKLSKQKKHPLIKKMNDTILKYIKDIKKRNEIERKIIKEENSALFKTKKNKKKYQLLSSLELSKEYHTLVLKLEKDLNNIYSNLDLKDKVEKRIAWACMINIAEAFYSIGDFKTALKYSDKAKLIDYKTKKTEAFRTSIIRKRNKLNIFYTADGKIKKDVNFIYLRYLKHFSI